ncbi:hypothetical protein TW95_gp1366 [Pandoravirus inopinatum]|uniref:Uncharacterized protein n=1 Tax=Pandoravirus inopinatum TaxID=1605721 RepID=A0A0B5J858_9VIRU|nr:hypothetical protein TW95_gp1366 [Pandoravirus inopinatum]AJF98100.1 hypothetical protein [Pandoravirus inopinatum]
MNPQQTVALMAKNNAGRRRADRWTSQNGVPRVPWLPLSFSPHKGAWASKWVEKHLSADPRAQIVVSMWRSPRHESRVASLPWETRWLAPVCAPRLVACLSKKKRDA